MFDRLASAYHRLRQGKAAAGRALLRRAVASWLDDQLNHVEASIVITNLPAFGEIGFLLVLNLRVVVSSFQHTEADRLLVRGLARATRTFHKAGRLLPKMQARLLIHAECQNQLIRDTRTRLNARAALTHATTATELDSHSPSHRVSLCDYLS